MFVKSHHLLAQQASQVSRLSESPFQQVSTDKQQYETSLNDAMFNTPLLHRRKRLNLSQLRLFQSSLPVVILFYSFAIILISPIKSAPFHYSFDVNSIASISLTNKQVSSFNELPIVDQPVVRVSLYENYTIGKEIVRIKAKPPSQSDTVELTRQLSDVQVLEFSLLNLNSYFNIDNKTGVISVISRVDIKQSVTYILDVKVVNRISSNSDSLSSHNSEIHRGADAEKLVAPFTKVAAIVDLIDINDNEPEPNKHVTHCFAYNNIESSIPLCTIPVGDADSGVNGQISFSIATEDGLSDTQEFKIDVNTGTIYKAKRNVKKLLEGDYSFVISIIDHGVPYLETAARIIVTIVAPANRTNNHAPIFIGNPEKLITISENAKVGTPISFIGATDADGDRVSMHIVSGNTEGNYAIEEGNLVIARDHLFSRNIVSNLTIMATDGIDSIYHNITVVVPKVVKAIPIRIFQHDTMLDRVSAVDEPIVANLTDDAVDVHYANFSIYSASSTYAMAAFTIDPCCGIVRLRKQLDYKMCKDCNLVIEITDTRFPRDYYRSFSKLNFQVLGSSTQPPSQVGPTMAPTKSDIKPISSTTSIASSDFETIPPTSIATPFPGIADTTTSYRITHASTSSLPSTFLDSNVLPVRSSTTPTPSLNKITTSSGNRSQAHVSKNVEKNTVTIDRPAHPTLSPSPPDIGRDSSSIEQLVTRPHVHRNHTHSTTAYWPTRPPPTAYHKSHPSIPDTEIATTPSPGLHRKRHSLFSFSGSSFIKYTTNTPEISKLTLQFRTCQSKFILMYSNSSHGSYILDAVGSNLRFRFAIPVLGSSGNFNGLIQLKSIMVNDGLWHELTLEKHGATYSLTVDKIFFSSTEAPIGKFAQSSFPNGIYHHYFGAETILVNEMGFIYDTVRENGLIGCMNDIRIGSVPLVVLEEVSLPGLGLTNIELGCNQNPTSMITCSPIMSFDVPPPPSAPGAKEPPIADSYLHSALTQILVIVLIVAVLLVCCIFAIACSSRGKSKNKRRRNKNDTLLRSQHGQMSAQSGTDTITRSINSRLSLRGTGHTHTPPIGRAHHSKYGAGDTVSLSAINEHKHKPPMALPPLTSNAREPLHDHGGEEDNNYENFATVSGAFGPGHPEYLSELRKLKPDFTRSSIRVQPAAKKQSSASTVTSIVTSSDYGKHSKSPRAVKNSSCTNISRHEVRASPAPTSHHAHSRSNVSNRSVNTPSKNSINSCNISQRPLLMSDSKESKSGNPPVVRKRLRIKNNQNSHQDDVDYDEVDLESEHSSCSELSPESRFRTFTRMKKDKMRVGDAPTTSDEDDDNDEQQVQVNGTNNSSEQETDNGHSTDHAEDVLVDINGARDNHVIRPAQRKPLQASPRQSSDQDSRVSPDDARNDGDQNGGAQDGDDDDGSEESSSENDFDEGVYEINGYHC